MLTILQQDGEILVCVKPAGVLSQPSPHSAESMLSLLENQCGGTVYPVHRLDRETGGVMVFARTRRSAAALSAQIAGGAMEKVYYCVLSAPQPAERGTLEDLLFTDRARGKTFVVRRPRKGVRAASLSYEAAAEAQGRHLLRVWLHTGRTHQIRAQFASRRLPLIGDARYGGAPGELALWCAGLGFSHPVGGERLSFFLPPPETGVWAAFHAYWEGCKAEALSPSGPCRLPAKGGPPPPNCYIFAAGDPPADLPRRPGAGDLVIAADGGYRTCLALGLTPDLLVGDFDSMEAPADFPHILRAPVEKDDTDTLLAVKEGLRRGCGVFHLYGGAGGRLDHTLANLQTLLYLRRQGARGYLYDASFTYTAIENETLVVPRTREWALLSVFCLGQDARGVLERGVQYPLTDATLTAGFPLGVSNHILEDAAQVGVADGALLIGWER